MNKRREIIPYKPYLKDLARKLRKNMTFSEVLLWQELKKKQMLGYDFDRQRPIDNYIVDFFCKDLKLAIEIDGESHTWEGAPEKDAIRQEALESLGVHFLRFDDLDVKKNMPFVLETIYDWIERKIKKQIKEMNTESSEKYDQLLKSGIKELGLSPKKNEFPSQYAHIDERYLKLIQANTALAGNYFGRNYYYKHNVTSKTGMIYQELLNEALNQFESYDKIVYRNCVSGIEYEEAMNWFTQKKGEVIQFPAALPTYSDASRKNDFHWYYEIIPLPENSAGRYVGDIGPSSEKEVLFKSHTCFEIANVTNEKVILQEVESANNPIEMKSCFWRNNP